MTAALRGWRKAPAPKGWEEVQSRLSNSESKDVQELARNLGVVFGDGRALEELKLIALRESADGEARREALRVIIQNKPDDLLPLLQKLVNDRATVGVAVEGLAQFDDPKTPNLVIGKYRSLRPEDRPRAINTLVTRAAYAQALLEAVEQEKIPRADVSAFHARQIQSFKNATLNELLSRVWGELRSTSEEKKKLIAVYHAALTKDKLKQANLSQGRLLYNQTCAACHRLFGEGKQVAPDLTGSNRDNLDYLLVNIIDPSAVVAVDFKMSVLAMKDGRVLNGVVLRKTPQTVTLQTQTEQVTVPAGDIEEITPTTASLMPEGLFKTLKEEQVRDLVAYLMSKQQVPLPEGK
ncbi:MAG: c-type cytochrome [Gemmataceae bacterium]